MRSCSAKVDLGVLVKILPFAMPFTFERRPGAFDSLVRALEALPQRVEIDGGQTKRWDQQQQPRPTCCLLSITNLGGYFRVSGEQWADS